MPPGTDPPFERLAYEAALRTLDGQERLVDELRSRTGVLLAAASLAASFLGQEAFGGNPNRGLAALALAAFMGAVAGSVYVLLPRADTFIFSVSGPALYEGLYDMRDDLAEVYRRLAYDLDRFWESNDQALQRLFVAFRVAALALAAEIVVLIAMVGDTLL